jgi:mono/diheme cytochrome c family protein
MPETLITPVAREYRRKRWYCRAYCAIGLYLVGVVVYWGIVAEVPVDYREQDEHFKYGSIGSDSAGGIPYWIWRILPEMFPEHLPDPEAYRALPDEQRNGVTAYTQFGYVLEEGRDTPIGFSKRRDLVERVGLNCALCHTSTVRVMEGMHPDAIYGSEPKYVGADRDRVIVLGMPAQTVDLQGYFSFLFRCAADGRFTTDNVMAYIAARTRLCPTDRFFYKRAIPEVRATLLARRQQLDYFDKIPPFGPGRVDTFTPYKTIQFHFPYDGTVGASDFPSLWNQRPREGMHLHWDGNNQSVFERNISASIGAGVTPVSLDMHRMLRVAAWIGAPPPDPNKTYTELDLREARAHTVPHANELPIPKYPFPIDAGLASGQGQTLYRRHCAECHDWTGKYVGLVTPIDDIQTDRHRLDSYTRELSANQNTLGAGHWWRFRNFRKTNGYANMPLDGLWARAPYLHNGSVPTLRDLLKKSDDRPTEFFRGDDEYDPQDVGFRHDRDKSTDGRPLFSFDTSLPGNGRGGHEYGTDLSDEEISALLEYLKTL